MITPSPNNQPVLVYEPNQRVRMGFVRSWILMVQNIVLSRNLIWQLFKRDFVAGYKQSVFGLLWLFISPLIGILSWVFMNATGILNPGDVGVPYPLYVLVGSTLWGLFVSVYASVSTSLSAGGALILQVNFPHEALVAQQVAQTIANFLINLLMISIIFVFFGRLPSWKAIFFPFTLLPIFLIGSGLGMVVAVITVVVHDINRMVTVVLGFMMFLTPVVYAPQFKNELIQLVITWNPMTYLIGNARDILLNGRIVNIRAYSLSCLMAAALFLFSWRLFFLSEHKVAEKL
jgi:ABC-type polysaccharide/polyol phosphate export permease